MLTRENVGREICDIDDINSTFDIPTKLYGTLLVAPNKRAWEEYSIRHKAPVFAEFVNPIAKNNYSRIIVAPDFENENLMLSAYENIVFLAPIFDEGVISYLNSKTKATIYVPKISDETLSLSCDRAVFAKYFELIKGAESIKFKD